MPTKFGSYELLKTLGSGAFGTTYQVRKGGKVYALKVLKPDAIRSEVDLRRFQRECRALQKINSPYVVPYHDHGVVEDDGDQAFFLVMEFVEGSDLQRRLKGKTFPLPEADIRSWVGQVLLGLTAIHEQKLVHRDLKPSNIFVATDGRVRILDFGLVKMLDYTTITHTGGMVGTPLYMSPEEMLGKDIDHRSDLYSFGVLLFHLLTGKFPIVGDNHLQLVKRVTEDPPARPSAYVGGLSNRLENLILRLLEKEPYLRPSNANEVRVLLERTAFFVEKEVAVRVAPDSRVAQPKQCLIRLLPNEKSVIDRATATGARVDGVVFQANYLPLYEGHLELLRERGIPYFFDPSTNRLPYSKFTQTKGLRELPYVYDRMNRLTPARLKAIADIRQYVEDVLNWQIRYGCDRLVAPFHFSKGLGSEWHSLDLKLLAESREYLDAKGRGEKLFAGVCVNIEEFTDEESRKALVNAYSRYAADGYLFYVDPIQERTAVPAQLYSYLSMLLDFKELDRPVVAGRVGNMGLGVLALGVDAFEAGVASLTFFTEQDLLEDRPAGYTMQTRYYMPDLLASVQLETATDILAAPEFKRLACKCPHCQGQTGSAIGKRAKEHFLHLRAKEIEALNSCPESERLSVFLKRAERAYRLAAEIRTKLAIKTPPTQHFKTWLEVFPEVAKRLQASTATA